MDCMESLCLGKIDGEWWGVALEGVLFLYAFFGLALVCDGYLVMSLETLCVRWEVREDVAGATFMAFGSAAPEIVINAISTIKGGDSPDLGIAAIIGSGMIAFLVIPGCCGLFAKETLEIKRRPLLRDTFTYGASLAALCAFFSDGVIRWYESCTLVGMYLGYIIMVAFSPTIRLYYRAFRLNDPSIVKQKRLSFVIQQQIQAEERAATETDGLLGDPEIPETASDGGDNASEDEDAPKPSALARIFGFFVWPLEQAFRFTCPKCEYNTNTAWLYPITFILSFIWVSVFSAIISSVVERWVDLSGASPAFLGLVLIAIGAEIPDTIQSVTVAKRGYGSMAVANSQGSQITNILVGLGLPWALHCLFNGDVLVKGHANLQAAAFFQFGNMSVNAIMLLGMAMIFRSPKARLDKRKGLFLVVAYGISLAGYGSYIFYFRNL
eukprot:TRINITY_DN10680_c0_g1_i4.p2 TRINITY_DN10680_c0_g1~~TRINITY_DN10680_c0_g1_i4.p2  ORF type:complete len:439 (+),score=76.47 TRINITY_DN10680_c0_g1_i4:2233-3549(+)